MSRNQNLTTFLEIIVLVPRRRRRGLCWVENVERRSPGWRPGRRLAIYVAYWVWVWSVCSVWIWLDGVESQAGSVAEGRGD